MKQNSGAIIVESNSSGTGVEANKDDLVTSFIGRCIVQHKKVLNLRVCVILQPDIGPSVQE